MKCQVKALEGHCIQAINMSNVLPAVSKQDICGANCICNYIVSCAISITCQAAELAEPLSQTLARCAPGGGTIVLGVDAVSCNCSHSPKAICVCLRIF